MTVSTPWMDEAKKFDGFTELTGHNDAPFIDGFFAETGNSWVEDKEWCAAFVWHCLHASGMKVPSGVDAVRAASYGSAIATKVTVPQYGDIVQMNYGQKGGVDHVTFYYGQTASPSTFIGYGGNQTNSVKQTTFSLADVYGFFRPVKAAATATTVLPASPVQPQPDAPPPPVAPKPSQPATGFLQALLAFLSRIFGGKK